MSLNGWGSDTVTGHQPLNHSHARCPYSNRWNQTTTSPELPHFLNTTLSKQVDAGDGFLMESAWKAVRGIRIVRKNVREPNTRGVPRGGHWLGGKKAGHMGGRMGRLEAEGFGVGFGGRL